MNGISCQQADAAIAAGASFGSKSSRERWQAILYYAAVWATGNTTAVTCAQAEAAIAAGRVFGCKDYRERQIALLAYLSKYG